MGGQVNEAATVLIRPGMSEAIDARMLPGPTPQNPLAVPELIQNYRWRQQQRFEKRPGTLSKGTTGLPAEGAACWVGDFNGCAAVSVAEATSFAKRSSVVYVHNGDASWSAIGRHGACVPLRRFAVAGRQLARPPGEQLYTRQSVTTADNGLLYACYLGPLSASTVIYIQEMTPEGVPLRTTSVTGETSPRLIWTGTFLLLVTNASGTVKVRTLDLTSFALGAATSLATAATSSSTMIEAAPLEDGTGIWLCCYATTSTNLKVLRLVDHLITHSADVTTTSAPTLYGIAGQQSVNIVVVYRDGTVAQATVYNSTLGSGSEYTLATQAGDETWTYQFVLVRSDADRYTILLSGLDDNASLPDLNTPYTYSLTLTNGGTVSTPVKLWHFRPVSKPVRIGADGEALVYCWLANGDGDWVQAFQGRHVLASFEVTAPSSGGAQLAGLSYEHLARGNDNFAGSMADLGDGRFAAVLNWSDPGKFCGIDCAVFTLALPTSSVSMAYRQTDAAGGALFVSGGCLYDVADVPDDMSYFIAENGFAHAPLLSLDLTNGGDLTADEEVFYVACYRRIDGLGRVQRSAASAPASITPTGTDLSVDVYVTTLGISNRWALPGEKVVAEVYRRKADGPYYYVGATDSVSSATGAVVLADDNADEDIVDDDGALDVDAAQPTAPSGARLIRRWGPRLASVGWEENVVQLSKFYRADTSWEFVDEEDWELDVPERITALGYMDGAGVILTKSSIFICTGDGPTDDGRAGAFDQPRPTPATVGADSQHVVEGPAGLFFYGGGMLWLLPRGFGQPQPVGEEIRLTLEAFPHLRSASRCVTTKDDCMHFVLAASDLLAAETKVAIWNNRTSGWNLDDIAGEVGAAAAVDGAFTWLLPTWDELADVPARVLSDDSAEDLSAEGVSTWIESKVGFGDWRPFGPIGWGSLEKLQIFGEIVGGCFVRVSVTVDEKATYTVGKTMSTEGKFHLEHGLQHPTGCAFTFSLYDAEGQLDRTAGLALHCLSIETRKQNGLRRVAAGDAERISTTV